jgi:hypothetical protein
MDFSQYPSIGATGDSFLRAYGYDLLSVFVIALAIERSHDSKNFVERITQKGMAEAEALWLWDILRQN